MDGESTQASHQALHPYGVCLLSGAECEVGLLARSQRPARTARPAECVQRAAGAHSFVPILMKLAFAKTPLQRPRSAASSALLLFMVICLYVIRGKLSSFERISKPTLYPKFRVYSNEV